MWYIIFFLVILIGIAVWEWHFVFFLIILIALVGFLIWRTPKTPVFKIHLEGSTNGFSFEDDLINIDFDFPKNGITLDTYKNVSFSITNKSDEIIQIEWEKCALVDSNGLSLRVVHHGFSGNKIQPNTVIATQSRVIDRILPYNYLFQQTASGFEIRPIFSSIDDSSNQKIRVLLSIIDKSGFSKIYDFEIKIEKVV